jgi:DNA-binding transcriptional ArsR family regulator
VTEDIGELLRAVADDTRRTMLLRLAQGPATSGQLADLFPISRPAVSQHLRVLAGAKLIETTVLGRHHWHQVRADRLADIGRWAQSVAMRAAAAPVLKPQRGGAES